MQISNFRGAILLTVAYLTSTPCQGSVIIGTVTDKDNYEPLIGASVYLLPGGKGTATDLDGKYQFIVREGRYSIKVSYVGYKDFKLDNHSVTGDTVFLNIEMLPDNQILSEVVVTAQARHDTESAQVEEQKNSSVVQSGVSAQEVEKTQDKDASEVIRRIPGISIIDEKFVMVRGLSQRYNNIWMNGGAVPSSEADSRAFSFDIIPSSQIDNMIIVKSPAPEYPADFTGGFVLVNTRRQPARRGLDLSLGFGINDNTHFREFVSGHRGGHFSLDDTPATYEGNSRIDPVSSGFNNNWKVKTIHPLADVKLNIEYSNSWKSYEGRTFSLVSALNYSRSYRSMRNMENSLYGPYDVSADRSVPLRKATDNQYTRDIRLGAMLNLTYMPADSRHLFEWKNVFNQTTKDRYSERIGFNAQSDNINDMEYYHSSRPTFNTQVTGRHNLEKDLFDWSVGYAFARRDLPDRRLIQRTDRTDQRMGIYRISREFTRLDEHTASLAGNYRRELNWASVTSTLKGGLYGEYRTRTYGTRQFQYGWQPDNSLPDGFMFNPDVQGEVLTDGNYGPDKLYMYEEVNFLNNYKARQTMGSVYAGWDLTWRMFDIYAGVRYEYCRQTLEMNTRQFEESLQSTDYSYNDLFPSVNLNWHINGENQLRLAYGRSTNRPEFRELSSSVFYDFDLGSSVMGNPDLKAAYIDNIDLRWEWYPAKGETVSVALFYKHFINPIEWTYTVAGGTDLIYSFINADGANNYGVEVDIRKNLGFIGLKDFSWSFNGALIKRKVQFDGTGNNIDRPMQGQSPYLVNAGIFYQEEKHGWNAALLYNIIGKRVIGVGNRYGTTADGTARNIPNSYEMPRHSLDLSVAKKFGNWSIKLAVRDLLAQRYLFKQIEEIVQEGKGRTVEEVTRSYKPGRNFNITIGYNF